MARKPTEQEAGKNESIYLRPSEKAYLLKIQPTITAAVRQIINERKDKERG